MKTAISIPDDVFEKVEETAASLGMSRSEFFTRAAQMYLATRLQENIKASYDAAFVDAEDDELQRQTTRKALLAVEWNE